ncbi:MAG TPA: N-acetyltransferase [Patescibacteria group bacterium]|nr:N-acetyltransferase [Patescibacteria group bacterium]
MRPETPADVAAIQTVNREAFGQEDEAALVDRLRSAGLVIVSLVATVDGEVAGHVLFTRLPVHTTNGEFSAVAMAPVAVRPSFQKQGIGSALVRAGLAACREKNESAVFVLGHENYYPRFGFSAALAEKFRGPFAGPAWMAVELTAGALPSVEGLVRYPAAWNIDQVL